MALFNGMKDVSAQTVRRYVPLGKSLVRVENIQHRKVLNKKTRANEDVIITELTMLKRLTTPPPHPDDKTSQPDDGDACSYYQKMRVAMDGKGFDEGDMRSFKSFVLAAMNSASDDEVTEADIDDELCNNLLEEDPCPLKGVVVAVEGYNGRNKAGDVSAFTKLAWSAPTPEQLAELD